MHCVSDFLSCFGSGSRVVCLSMLLTTVEFKPHQQRGDVQRQLLGGEQVERQGDDGEHQGDFDGHCGAVLVVMGRRAGGSVGSRGRSGPGFRLDEDPFHLRKSGLDACIQGGDGGLQLAGG